MHQNAGRNIQQISRHNPIPAFAFTCFKKQQNNNNSNNNKAQSGTSFCVHLPKNMFPFLDFFIFCQKFIALVKARRLEEQLPKGKVLFFFLLFFSFFSGVEFSRSYTLLHRHLSRPGSIMYQLAPVK